MNDLDILADDEDVQGTTFRDVITLCLMGFVAVVIMILPHLNPPGEDAKEDVKPQGMLMVEMRWAEDNTCDIDLWVQAPGDISVGYSNKTGEIFALLRDVLKDPPHQEIAVARNIPSGEYTINAHSYRCNQPMTAHILITRTKGDRTTELVEASVDLPQQGVERTIIRFTLDDNGNIVEGSMHNLQKDLRSS